MPQSKPRLVTIPISHFCEKARWSLELAGVDYEEDAHLQLLHKFAARKAGGGWTVPVLVTADGAIGESSEIVRWADSQLPPEQRLVPDEHATEIGEIEHELDRKLGVQGRRWMYASLLDTDIPKRFGTGPMPAWERRVMPALLPMVSGVIKRALHASPEEAPEALARVDASLDWVEELLSDGRDYLVGDRFTAADMTFAALSAAFLLPDRYGVELPGLDDLPDHVAAEVRRLRERPAGRFALRIIDEHRPEPAWRLH